PPPPPFPYTTLFRSTCSHPSSDLHSASNCIKGRVPAGWKRQPGRHLARGAPDEAHLPGSVGRTGRAGMAKQRKGLLGTAERVLRSEEHTSELQSRFD